MTKKKRFLGRGRALFLLASLVLLLPIAAGTLSRATAQDGEDSLYKHLSVFTEVLSLIQRSYVDETSIDRLFAGALDGTTDALDPLAAYVEAERVDAYREALAIGAAHSGVSVARDAGISYVLAIEPGSPAEQAGIRQGDILAEIDGQSTREMPLWDLQIRLAAATGTARLELLRRGQSREAELPLGPFERTKPTVRVDRGIPILRVTRVEKQALEAVEELLKLPETAASARLVVDLRGIAGGEGSVAYDLAALFAVGDLGELRSRGETLSTFSSATTPKWSGRLAVLTDAGSQGPSEILAAILRQSADAELVGSRTFGHAGRLASRALSSGATLFYSDAFFTGPDGVAIDRGLEPGVVVQATRQSLGGGGGSSVDVPLQRALDLLLQDVAERDAA